MIATSILTAVAIAPIGCHVDVAPGRTVPSVTVTMTADGKTDLDLPSKWAGSERLWRARGTPACRAAIAGRPSRP